MPHATSPHDSQEEQDDILIQQALDPENPVDFSRELEPGEKADDAIDFGDLGDDDLADDDDEDDAQHTQTSRAANTDDSFGDLENFVQEEGLPELIHEIHPIGDGDEFDDLFGDALSSPVNVEDELTEDQLLTTPVVVDTPYGLENDRSETFPNMPSRQPQGTSPAQTQDIFRPLTTSSEGSLLSKEQQLQHELFAMSGSGSGMMDKLQYTGQYSKNQIAGIWPKFERDTILRFMDLIPHKIAHFTGKKPAKPPKSVQPTRLSLELAQDQEKNFRLPPTLSRTMQDDVDHLGIVTIQRVSEERDIDDSLEIQSDYEFEPVGRVTWQDLQIVCEEWETKSVEGTQRIERKPHSWISGHDEDGVNLDHESKDFEGRQSVKVSTIQGIKNKFSRS